jgi:hypothetical protein
VLVGLLAATLLSAVRLERALPAVDVTSRPATAAKATKSPRKPVGKPGRTGRLALSWLAVVLAIPGLARSAASDTPVSVRTENRAGFGRLLFEFPSRVGFQITQTGNRVIIKFADATDLGDVDTLPRNVTAITGGASRAEIAVATGAQVRPGRIGNQIFVDVLDPVPAVKTPPPVSAGSSQPTPDLPGSVREKAGESGVPLSSPGSAAAADAKLLGRSGREDSAPALADQASEPNHHAERSENTAPPASALAAPPTPAVAAPAAAPQALVAQPIPVTGGRTGWAFFVPFEPSVGAAAFRRGDEAIVVFDERRPLDLGLLRRDGALAGASVQTLPSGTVIRLPLPPATGLALQRQATGWVLQSGAADLPSRPIRADMSDGRLRFSANAPGQIVTIVDPASGTVLLVGTQRRPGQGVPAGRHTPEFEILPTWQGVVAEPLSDRLTLSAVRDGFALTAMPEGLALAPPTKQPAPEPRRAR